jgi:hypothetical protein
MLFAFEDSTNPSQDSFTTGFKNRPHLFEQALTRNLLGWHYPEATLLQCVDGILLCRATELLICRVTESFLKLSGLPGIQSL